MIQLLNKKYQQAIAYFFFLLLYVSVAAPVYAGGSRADTGSVGGSGLVRNYAKRAAGLRQAKLVKQNPIMPPPMVILPQSPKFIGGPSQPEMSSFKSVSTDNMVNLFTGDFNYNIPLLDVGGYPVNIYYDGNIGMEQEASWVGLGWNINPGSVSRNMRGIPDDFDGTDTMVEQQNLKPNVTWGGRLGADFELCGVKNFLGVTVGGSLGASVNSYLGPALDVGIKGGLNFSLAQKITSEKNVGNDTSHAISIGVSGSATLSSRDGLTLSGSASLTGRTFQQQRSFDAGLSLSTSYNSRVGIKDLQLSGEMTISGTETKEKAAQYKADHKGKEEPVQNGQYGENLYATTISFARPSYIPTIRMPMTNTAWSGHFQAGAGLFGAFPSFEVEAYNQTSQITNTTQKKPLVGYMYYQKAVNNPDAVMDFTRLGDKEVTPNTPVISAPQYTYDVFSVQGEGTGGSIRAYRTDQGYVRDNFTGSTDNSIDAGLDIGPPGHYGGNFNTIKTPTTIGKWAQGNKLDGNMNFATGKDLHQLVYLRNPGESTVLDNGGFNNIGGTDLVRYQIGGDASAPTIEPSLQHYSPTGNKTVISAISNTLYPTTPIKRSQIVTFLTADEAVRASLDKTINNYQPGLDANNDLQFNTIPRVGGYRKGHHLSQINVTESDGKRYIYGIPIYSITQTDFTFSVTGAPNADIDKISLGNNTQDWVTANSSLINIKGVDGYYQSTATPAYAHSFLLTGLLSPDYVDVTGNGITEDDLGDAVKFNYTMVTGADNITPITHKWRTPMVQQGTAQQANFNAGNRSETKDDKGIVSYGEREQWYLHSIESKTMVAIFTLAGRDDGKGVYGTDPTVSGSDVSGGIVNGADNTVKRLDHIDLYNKADLKANGLTGARPIKTVWFTYNYALCAGTPDNPTPGEGKLTLQSIYFTFNGQSRANKTQYIFAYTNNDGSGNPVYEFNGQDRWGTYKPAINPSTQLPNNPAGLPNKDYPYSLQDNTNSQITNNAGAWALKKVLLPSGGQIEVSYESDDYAYVQNLHAAQMMQVTGFSSSQPRGTSGLSNALYDFTSAGLDDNNYAVIQVPQACASNNDVLQKYLVGISQFCFRYSVTMPKGEEYLTSYAYLAQDADPSLDYGYFNPDAQHSYIWVKLKTVGGYSPLSLTALEYLREQLPGQAYPGYDLSDASGIDQIKGVLTGLLSGLKAAFQDPVNYLRSQGLARYIGAGSGATGTSSLKCFVRLNNPIGFKYGGGSRVHAIILRDNWNAMTNNGGLQPGQYTSSYGQVYDYTTTETLIDGTQRTISSGVASYEPSIGGEENPFTSIVQYEDRLPLGPASYGSVEMPILESFFPSPLIGYSKITVRSLADSLASQGKYKIRSGIGRQVTEFYTAKDYPVYCNYTPFDASSDVQEHESSLLSFWYKHAFDSRALSQGFIVVTNDMHGKLKSQSSYAATDDNTRINYTENFYKNTGVNSLGDTFDFVDGTKGGAINAGNMGVDMELMTDARQFSVKSSSKELQVQVDLFPVLFPFWIPFPWTVFGQSESEYRAVTTTKVISYHSVTEKVLVIDKGSQVTTQNLLRDANTGEVIVNQTNNEFNQPVYTTTYPAYWAYSGMGPAWQNIDAVYSGASFSNGIINTSNGSSITSPTVPLNSFESGDELLILNASQPSAGCDAGGASPAPSIVTNGQITTQGIDVIWAYNQNKNITSLTDPTPNFIFLDSAGNPYTNSNVTFRIIRSGKRNLLGEHVQAVTNMVASPIITNADTTRTLVINNTSNAVNASAIEYKERWQTDPDEIGSFITVSNSNCGTVEQPDCNPSDNGYHLEKSINPYRKGLLGNFRPYRDLVYYGNRAETNPLTPSNLPKNGFLDNSFALYWGFNATAGMQPLGTRDVTPSSNWVFKSRTTRVNARGLELETVDALNIYTAAQYGYNKTLPTAITNNAAYGEAVYEGFEDNNYNNFLSVGNNNLECANTKYIDFSTIYNAQIISTAGLNFNAHTGQNVLQINPGNTAVKTVAVKPQLADTDAVLSFASNPVGALDHLGGNKDVSDATPLDCLTDYPANFYFSTPNSPTSPGTAGVSVSLEPGNQINNGNYFHSYSAKWDTYINVTQSNSYSFTATMNTNTIFQFGASPPQGSYSNGFGITIQDLYGKIINQTFLDLPNAVYEGGGYTEYRKDSEVTYNVFLCKGIYHVIGGMDETFASYTGTTDYNDMVEAYSWSSNIPSFDYTDTHVQASCTYTAGIPGATPNITHPIFSMPAPTSAGMPQEMVFSAWVREDGAATNQTTYSNNQVQLSFTDANNSAVAQTQYDAKGYAPQQNAATLQTVTLTPAGPIIDGWQRYEGYFSAPQAAAFLNMAFVNTSTTNNIYFDDIRIHPFNADMKSYIYDPITQRLVAQLDANNYASFYEYDEEGTLIRTKAETIQGIKTINETRSAKQKAITGIQQN